MTSYLREFAGKKKPRDYYQKLIQQITETNKEYHPFLTINSAVSKEKNSFPFSTKANICVKGHETTAGSKILKGYVPPFNATVTERLLNTKEFSFLGSTSMDEFGFGTFGLNCEVPARNAFDSEYVAGGSSSGAAVATAMLKYHVAISESTGGSITTPSAFNGVVGFTPTYGAVSRYGLIDYANSLDKIGVMARSAEDAKRVFDVIRGPDSYDTTCVVDKITDSKKKRIFLIKELMERTDGTIKSHFEKFVSKLESTGYSIETVSSKILSKAIAPYYIIAMAEASTNLAKYDGYKYGLQEGDYTKHYNEFFTDARKSFGIEAKRRIILGSFIRGKSQKDKYYTKAAVIRSAIIKEMSAMLKDGFILSPALPVQTPKIKDAQKLSPLENYALDMFTIPPNLGGFPHISFPYDYIDNLPTGAQLITGQGNDYALMDFVTEWENHFKYRFKHNLGEL